MNEELKLSKVEIEKKQNMLNEMDKEIKTFEIRKMIEILMWVIFLF